MGDTGEATFSRTCRRHGGSSFPRHGTLPVAIFNFVSYASIDWGSLMSAAVIVTVPIMVIALFTQKYVVSGLTAGATKG